jgi:predicted RNase H-like nuclease (RuvC/YqgF family)
MPPEKIQVSARIPKPLYDKVVSLNENMTITLVNALELLVEKHETNLSSNETNCISNETDLKAGETSINIYITKIDELENHIMTLKTFNDTLKSQLEEASENKEELKEQFKINDENQLLRITDLKEEISILSNELTNKNDTIKNLTTITESQIKGYKLIEAPGAKKKWWQFW